MQEKTVIAMASTSVEPKASKDIVLSYYDCLLRRKDVNLLKGPHWLNDVIIGFYFEYLDRKFKKDGKNKLLFVSPELTQILKMTQPSEYSIFLDPINASSSSFIFFPLNNCDKVDVAGGSHWSLLIYSQLDKTCYHFDSCKPLNSVVGSEFSKNLMCYFSGKKENRFIEADCPQQANGYDCGLFVLCVADVISEYVLQNCILSNCRCSEAKDLVLTKRSVLLDLIDTLKKNHPTL